MRDEIPGSDRRSNGGWAIVLERGGGTPAKWVGVSADIAAPGTTLGSGTHVGDGTRFIRWEHATWYLPNPWRTDQLGRFVKVANNGDDSDYIRGLTDAFPVRYRNRYILVPAVVSGQYIRWANMQWCR